VAEFGIGGGFAVRYTMDSEIPAVSDYAQVITGKLNSLVTQAGLDFPRLIVEPGRAIVGQAGIALYTVGAVKEIPGVRKYVCVDGGMSDNIRPSLYEARYEMLLANRPLEPQAGRVTVAGKLCESGDILARDINLPSVSPGDLMAVPVCGAYCIPLSSNYNALPKPAIVVTRDGEARLVRRRESYQDLMRLDVA
ncbi:MAG: diaminopimelate decarboxylase, partial [Dehalococcoidia bacterium]|nr:diaminopimelate decarboxylase [Dehalococcoidia bacterium]